MAGTFHRPRLIVITLLVIVFSGWRLASATNPRLSLNIDLPQQEEESRAEYLQQFPQVVEPGEFVDVDLPDDAKQARYHHRSFKQRHFSIELACYHSREMAEDNLVNLRQVDEDLFLLPSKNRYCVQLGVFGQQAHAQYQLYDVQLQFPELLLKVVEL